MSERTVLVTGSTDGIGKETARALASGGMRVIVHGRTKPKVDAALAELKDKLPGANLDGVAFDLGRMSDVRRGATAIKELVAGAPLVLVNNAGIFASERVMTPDRIELTFAVNHVGPFLLTELLQPARTINVASMAHTRGNVELDNLDLLRGFTGYGAYARSKLANVMHALSLADRGREAYSLHPGVIGTKLLRQGFGPVKGASVEAGAKTSVRLASAEGIAEPPGTYFSDGAAVPPAHAARDKNQRDRLWDATRNLAGLAGE